MAIILNIETATPLCTVALAADGKVLAKRETFEEKSHASRMTVFIGEILDETGIGFDKIKAVAIGKGPGSYTGLRIGVSTAKGICYGAGIPLIAVDTLRIMIRQAIESENENIRHGLFCPMIDARRMEVFTCLADTTGKEIESISAKIINTETYADWLAKKHIYFFGTGMEKCRATLDHPHAHFIENIFPHAASLAILSEEKFNRGEFENVAYFEPFYLKEFVATIPKKGLAVR